MAWHDGSTCAFVFNGNLGQYNAEKAMSTLRDEFCFTTAVKEVVDSLSVDHCLCLTTSKEPGMRNNGVNTDIVQISCLLLNSNAELPSQDVFVNISASLRMSLRL